MVQAAVGENPLALQYASDRWRCDKAGLDAGDNDMNMLHSQHGPMHATP